MRLKPHEQNGLLGMTASRGDRLHKADRSVLKYQLTGIEQRSDSIAELGRHIPYIMAFFGKQQKVVRVI